MESITTEKARIYILIQSRNAEAMKNMAKWATAISLEDMQGSDVWETFDVSEFTEDETLLDLINCKKKYETSELYGFIESYKYANSNQAYSVGFDLDSIMEDLFYATEKKTELIFVCADVYDMKFYQMFSVLQ